MSLKKNMYLYLTPFKYNELKKTIEIFIQLHANKLKNDDWGILLA